MNIACRIRLLRIMTNQLQVKLRRCCYGNRTQGLDVGAELPRLLHLVNGQFAHWPPAVSCFQATLNSGHQPLASQI